MYPSLRSILFKTTDPEWIHEVVLKSLAHTPLAAALALGRKMPEKAAKLWGIDFPNRLGLAAGFDKDAVAIHAFKKLGFGHVEIGTVTPRAQSGNPKPRLFRCPIEQAVINRMGFPGLGMDVVAENLRKHRSRHPHYPVGINIGKMRDTPLEAAADDYLACFQKLRELGDFFVVNISSPNTPGLRGLKASEYLNDILQKLQEANTTGKPFVLKIVIDFTKDEILSILDTVQRNHLAGIAISNTSVDHSAVALKEQGGLSGRPIAVKSTEMIRFISRETGGRLPIIGIGGVFTRDDFREKLDAGASLVQLYTGFIYQGPFVAHQILN